MFVQSVTAGRRTRSYCSGGVLLFDRQSGLHGASGYSAWVIIHGDASGFWSGVCIFRPPLGGHSTCPSWPTSPWPRGAVRTSMSSPTSHSPQLNSPSTPRLALASSSTTHGSCASSIGLWTFTHSPSKTTMAHAPVWSAIDAPAPCNRMSSRNTCRQP